MQENGQEEQLERCVQHLPGLEHDGGPQGEEEEDEVVGEGHPQDGQDVELVSGEVIVQDIAFATVRH